MSVIVPIASALPLKADVAAVGRESPKLTRNGLNVLEWRSVSTRTLPDSQLQHSEYLPVWCAGDDVRFDLLQRELIVPRRGRAYI